MARRTMATALATTAALLLTACGGSETGSADSTDARDAGTSPSAPGSAEAAVGRPDAAGAPDVSAPRDLHQVFDFDEPSEAKHAAALANAENYIRALNHGFAEQDPNDPAYQYYSTGQAARYAKTQIQAWVKGGWAPTGTDKYYDENVTTLSDGKRVLVTFCRDQAKFYGKEIKTGKILYTEDSLASYQKFTLLMFPPSASASAVWTTRVIEVRGEAKECREA
ncbi:hypothetical protein AB0I77_30500 [Streptomyces sp. NPDC050619]|uniref:hypothetical protein n=1 Tax=Streptomyces sp. NPDC050619 TaxID=3157214 RepID=UPI00342931DF